MRMRRDDMRPTPRFVPYQSKGALRLVTADLLPGFF